MQQQALIIVASPERKGLSQLNELLKEGWKYVSSCPMPGTTASDVGDSGNYPTCLVIIEKVFN